jgi:hypothetical protein
MRITKDHYEKLKEQMAGKLADTPPSDLTAYMENIKATRPKTYNMRLAWDLFGSGVSHEFKSELYKYVNDSHIQTAILRISKELGFYY